MTTYYLILTKAHYESCLKRGRIEYDYSDPHYQTDDFHKEIFEEPYDYMLDEYRKRTGRQANALVWLWCHKPDLRLCSHLAKGTQGVRLTIDLDPDHVLVSDFDVWHIVLNAGTYQEDGFSSKQEQRKSWEIIFDPDIHHHPDWQDPLDLPPLRQGVISHIDMTAVTKVDTFLAR